MTDATTIRRISSAVKDQPHVSPDWKVTRQLIDGVQLREAVNMVTANGITVEVHRDDWGIVSGPEQIINVSLRAGAISAWHMHERKTDHLFTVAGHLRVVLYDDRDGSPTLGKLDILHAGAARPTLIVIPPGVWHGVQNIGHEIATFVNYFDEQYAYDNPDDWRLPFDTDEIPYRFT